MHSKEFVARLRQRGFARQEAIALLGLVFGISPGAATLFVDSHPAWADETGSNELNRSVGGLQPFRGIGLPSRN
jgi:hypothetical protein